MDSLVCIVLVLLVVSLAVLMLKSKEGYCTDISGGFQPPCGCQGDCAVDF
jgi:hypothetical protein